MKYKLIVKKGHWWWPGKINKKPEPPPMIYVWEYPDRKRAEMAWYNVSRSHKAYSKIISVKMFVGSREIKQLNKEKR